MLYVSSSSVQIRLYTLALLLFEYVLKEASNPVPIILLLLGYSVYT